MENQANAEVRVEMDIADFSSKTVQRIDIQNVVDRVDPHKVGITVVMSFTDGSTGTILVITEEGSVHVTPYARPRMGHYTIIEEGIEEENLAQVP
jgi:hypothetical protein